MAALRAEAAGIATLRSWPDSYKERPWKYHDVSRLEIAEYVPALDAVDRAVVAPGSCPVTGEHSVALVQQNGETVFTEESPKGLDVVTFEANSDARLQAIIDEGLGSLIDAGRSKFTALHYAFQRGGVLVHTAANAEIAEPVRIVRDFVTDKQFAAPHTLIVTGANSRVTVVEELRSGAGDILIVPAVEVIPGPGSTVRYVVLYRCGPNTKVYAEEVMASARDSAYTGMHVAASGRVIKGHIESQLTGRGSSSELFGLTLGGGREHMDFFTIQDHIGPDTRSDLLFKAALKGRSRSVYYGLTRVGLEAKNADANQENRNLILSDTAKADSDPVLEILTSDVIRVSHGATAGPVDEEQLYYLQTRGLDPAAAEGLLVRAFLGEVLDRLPGEALHTELADAVEAKLAG